MRIILHEGADIEHVYKIKIFSHNDGHVSIPYLEHRKRIKGQKDSHACVIGTQPLSNVKSIKDK